MLLSNIKGSDSLKAIGVLVGCFSAMFNNEKLKEIVKERKPRWILDFFSVSLEECTDQWVKMFLALNPDKTENDITIPSVIAFAGEVKNDPDIMTLFFSQSEQNLKTSSGSPTENSEATEVTPIHS